MTGIAALARPPQSKEGPTPLAPAGTAEVLRQLRSTAGSCFGRFISCSFVTLVASSPGRRTAHRTPACGSQACRDHRTRNRLVSPDETAFCQSAATATVAQSSDHYANRDHLRTLPIPTG